jgi:hypothetical protein
MHIKIYDGLWELVHWITLHPYPTEKDDKDLEVDLLEKYEKEEQQSDDDS